LPYLSGQIGEWYKLVREVSFLMSHGTELGFFSQYNSKSSEGVNQEVIQPDLDFERS
jgi:hypothetical protein